MYAFSELCRSQNHLMRGFSYQTDNYVYVAVLSIPEIVAAVALAAPYYLLPVT